MPDFPVEALSDDCSPEAMTAMLQGMLSGFADTLGALSVEFDDVEDE